MSKLDDLIDQVEPGRVGARILKAELKEIFLELLNDSIKAVSITAYPGIVWLDKDEVRQKIEEL